MRNVLFVCLKIDSKMYTSICIVLACGVAVGIVLLHSLPDMCHEFEIYLEYQLRIYSMQRMNVPNDFFPFQAFVLRFLPETRICIAWFYMSAFFFNEI